MKNKVTLVTKGMDGKPHRHGPHIEFDLAEIYVGDRIMLKTDGVFIWSKDNVYNTGNHPMAIETLFWSKKH